MKFIKSTGAQLNRAQVAIQNAKNNSEILSLVTPCGYDATALQQGQTLHNTAQVAFNAQQAAIGDQLTASAEYQASRKTAHRCYQHLARSCRALWTNRSPILAKVGLDKRMPARDGDFLTRGRTLFNIGNYDQTRRTELSVHGYDPKKFAGELAKIDEMDNANHHHEITKGATRQATQELNGALKELVRWMGRLKSFARLALTDKPQLMEKLGLGLRTSKTKAQRAAPVKAAATRKTNREKSMVRLAA